MAWDDPYIGVDEFKARANIAGGTRDAEIETALRAASRQVERLTGQVFNRSAADAVRYVTAAGLDALFTPPFVALTELATDDGTRTYTTAWDTTDYELWPFDAEDAGRPYTLIRRAPYGVQGWGLWPRGIRLTGTFGWPAVPEPIVEATYLLANRLRSLWTAPFGQSGAGELGAGLNMTNSVDPIVRGLLTGYKVVVL